MVSRALGDRLLFSLGLLPMEAGLFVREKMPVPLQRPAGYQVLQIQMTTDQYRSNRTHLLVGQSDGYRHLLPDGWLVPLSVVLRAKAARPLDVRRDLAG